MKKTTKNNIKKAGGVWVRVLSSTVLCFFLYFTLMFIVNMFARTEVGYRIVQTNEDGERTVISEHYYTVDEDPAVKIELPDGHTREPITEGLSAIGANVFNAVVLVLMLITVGVFPYNVMWKLGSKDRNKVRYGRKKQDLLRGLKIGAIANVPSFAMYLLLILAKYQLIFPQYFTLFRYPHMPYLPYINWVCPAYSAAEISWPSMVALFLPMLFVPAVCAVGYILGYREFSVLEKLLYRTKKEPNNDEEI